ERMEQQAAEGFRVSVADVTNDPATLAKCGRLKAERDTLQRLVDLARQPGGWLKIESAMALRATEVEDLRHERDALRADVAAVSLRAQEWEIKWAHTNADLRACAEALDRILPAMVTVTRW